MFAVLASAAACREREPATTSEVSAPAAEATPTERPHERELARLRAFEEQRRDATDFAALPPADAVLGPDPYRIAPLPGGKRWIGILRGTSAVVAIDASGAELARAAAPRSPTGLAVSTTGDVLVAAEAARELAHYRTNGGRLERVATLPIDALGIRDVALAPDAKTAYAVEEREGRLIALSLERDRSQAFRRSGARELGRCHGPIQVEAIAGHVAVNCLLDHAIEIRRDDGVIARIHHDGPMWSFALHRERDGGVLVAAGGVEDHPLERKDGGFGYIDSYVYLYRLAPGAARPVKLAAINTSALGAITPKWVAIRTGDAGDVAVTTAGHASAGLVTLTWRGGDFTNEPRVKRRDLPPGTTAAHLADDGAVVAANSLLDAWVTTRTGAPHVTAIANPRPARSVESRVGELLFFTTMMAPWNPTEGKRSRFTCETCHYEGYGDGRIHYTGRGDVHAATRPLYGLFNNRPHFSRALDKTMAKMVHAEFRVANRHNERSPWFGLTRADVPWLALVEGAPARLSPVFLRRSFMTFLMDFTHRSNPAAMGRTRFTELERAGAKVFRDRCEACHAARLIAEDAGSAVPFERWESLVLSPAGPIVWATADREKTGVVPYVHANGARVPPLRRLYKKWPYFTNGSAKTLAGVLDRFAWDPRRTSHDGAPAGGALERLTPGDKRALLAFLDLL